MFKSLGLALAILSSHERQRFALIIGISVLASLFDAVGVAIIFPFLSMIADPGYLGRYPLLLDVAGRLGLSTPREVTVAFGLFAFLVILLSMAVRAGATYAQTRFSLMRSCSIGARLLERILGMPYVWFLTQNTSDFSQTLLSEVDLVIRESILPLVLLISNAMILAMVAVLIFVVDPVVALSATLLLLGTYLCVYFAFRGALRRIGAGRWEANKRRFRIVNESSGSIKDVKILALEQTFLRRFYNTAKDFAEFQAKGLLIGKMPRFALEAVSYGGFILFVTLLFLDQGRDIAEVIPLIGLIGMAGTKLFPALQQFYQHLSALRLSRASLEALHDKLASMPDPGRPPEAGTIRIERDITLHGVDFRYPGAAQPVLSDLSLTIPARSQIGFVGGTGAGKTTVIDIILGLVTPDAGQLLVDSRPITTENVRSWQKSLGYVPQQIFLADRSVKENIAFGVAAEKIDMQAVERAARLANLHDFVVEELPQGYDTEVGERGVRLSGGQRQRIGIARALYHDPDVLIFDEATSALDNLTERAVMEAVNNLGHQKTVIMIAHRLSTVRNCDTIFLLEKGRIVGQGSYDDLVATNATFRRMAQG